MAEPYQIDESHDITITAQMLINANDVVEAAGYDPATALLIGLRLDEIAPVVALFGKDSFVESATSVFEAHKEKLMNIGEIDINWKGKLDIVEIANGVLRHFEFKDRKEMCEVMFALGFFTHIFLNEKLPDIQ